MNYFWCLLVILGASVPVRCQWGNRQTVALGQNCISPENYNGYCVTLTACPQVVNVFRTQNPRVAQQYVIALQRACGTYSVNNDPVICCTRPVTRNEIPFRPTATTESPDFFFPTEEVQIRPTPPWAGPRNSQTTNPFLPGPRRNNERTTSTTTTTPRTTRTTTTQSTTRRTTAAAPDQDDNATECRGPDYKLGKCMPIEQCQELVDRLLASPKDETYARYLRASNQACGGKGSAVCCPRKENPYGTTPSTVVRSLDNEIPRTFVTEEEGCGFTKNPNKKIVGGQASKQGSWPWIALLGYDSSLGSTPFKCGGALITPRHVVTAAHCIRRDLTFVRLGDHDLTTEDEAQHQDIQIARKEIHPDYDRRDGHSDIALLYLQHNVQLTENVAPICVPRSQEMQRKSYTKHSPFVAGWGKTMEGGNAADVLQELQIPVLDNSVCLEAYRQQQRLFSQKQFDSAVICAGILDGGKDTCHGDSGGPLMLPEPYKDQSRFYLIGVVSYGIGCARPNVPGVYTSVPHFMGWLEKLVADTP